MSAREIHKTLSGRDYSGPEVYELERERIFHREWFYVGRAEQVAEPGDALVHDVAGESILVVRGRDGRLHAHFNVCRHRGARLCDVGKSKVKGAIKCPYHAWSYAHDGTLIGTPNVAPDEIDRSSLSLWPVNVDVWEGFLFVCLADDPEPLRDSLGSQADGPLRFEEFGLGDLRIGARTVSEVPANWKILIENYNECLHCPTVHPELVQIVPLYKTGSVVAPDRPQGGTLLSEGSNSFTYSGTSARPTLPGLTDADANTYYGAAIFPNMFIDVTGTCAIVTTLVPQSASHTQVVSEYLFAPEEVARRDFEAADVVEFSELVAQQDYDVCIRVQQGVSSKAFTNGVLAEKDDLLHTFHERYLHARDAE